MRFVLLAATPVFFAGLGAATCWLAGNWQLPFVWAVVFSQALIYMVGIFKVDPDLIQERMHPPKGQDKDRFGGTIVGLLYLSQFAIAGLDIGHWHIATDVPIILQIGAVGMMILDWVLLMWAMAINRYFSIAIRLQPDRGQKVITEGPYALVRHPGYAFGSLAFVSQGVALGSWLTLIPAILVSLQLVYRTILEERMLTENLEGYKEYAKKVRYRWYPGLW